MPKAYDRVKNASTAADVFIKTEPWTNEVETAFETWAGGRPPLNLEQHVMAQLNQEVAVSFKALEGSICCTLAHQPSRAASIPYLLTGWSNNPLDALLVALYKLEVMMNGVWEAPPARPAPRRR